MNGNWKAYSRANSRSMLSALAILVLAQSLPRFALFSDRSENMLQLHLLLELFAVIVAILIAVASWYDLRNDSVGASDGHHVANPQSGILLAGFSIVAVADLVHALTYDGMPGLITPSSTHRAIFFWLAGRSFAIVTLALVALDAKFNVSRGWLLAIAFTASSAVFLIGTFKLDWIPLNWLPGSGVTPFKTGFELALSLANIAVGWRFINKARGRDRPANFGLASACFMMAMGELMFTHYIAPADFTNNFGHAFKIASYFFLYQNVFVAAIQHPYQNAKNNEDRLRTLTTLSSDWFWEQDAQFRLTRISEAAAGIIPRAMLGRTPWELPIMRISAQKWDNFRAGLQRHESFRNLEFALEVGPGSERWLCASGMPVFDEAGEFIGYRGVGTDITERKMSEQRIEFLAYYDPLTRLPNRRLLQNRFEQNSAAALRTETRLALLFLDADNFKSINDSLGHDAGDLLLQQIAERLEKSVRELDTVARQGGDEFMILIAELSRGDDLTPMVVAIMERLQEPFMVGQHSLSTSVSIGIAIFPDDGNNFDTLGKNADLAMYRAKNSGRNTYRYFDHRMNQEAQRYLTLRNGLRDALEKGEFVLHYQPQIDLISGRMTGVEALIRWNHPDMGMVSPAHFIPVAEESGLIVQIGAWVLREACRQAVAWEQAGLPPFVVAVNLSAAQFKNGIVVQDVMHALLESGLDPRRLELELTESILVQDIDLVQESLKRLKETGISLSIDDFGTGYSSLSYLRRFDIDKLKIDQSFVRDMTSNDSARALVLAIIQMARSLGLQTIAEGIETDGARQILSGFQCNEGQGYYFARPMPPESLADFMLKQGEKK